MGGPCSSSLISLAHTTPTIPFFFFSFTILFLFFSSYIRSTLRHFRKKERSGCCCWSVVCVPIASLSLTHRMQMEEKEEEEESWKGGPRLFFFFFFSPPISMHLLFFAKKRKKRRRKSFELDFRAKNRGKRRKTHITFRSAPPAGRTVGHRAIRSNTRSSLFSFATKNKLNLPSPRSRSVTIKNHIRKNDAET